MSVGSRTLVDENPATREELAELEDADRAVRRAREAFPCWAALPGRARGRIMNGLADVLEEHGPRLAELESADNGRPLRETTTQQAIIPGFYRYFAGWCDKIEGSTIPVEGDYLNYLNYTERVPVGVCGAITPWNHPLLIATKRSRPRSPAGTRSWSSRVSWRRCQSSNSAGSRARRGFRRER